MPDQTTELPENFDLTLLANFVHQIVNPLNGVAGTLDNLAEGIIKDEKRRTQRLNAARAQLEHCITLIRNLAFLAQSDLSSGDQDRRKSILPQVIIEAAMFFQEEGALRGIAIRLMDRSTQNMVFAPPQLLRQVLMNIFDNFVKYGQVNSTVQVDQRIQRRTNMGLIEIKGISQYPLEATDIERIGALGYRGANAKKVVASGSGLGMFICRKIVSQLGGTLDIQASAAGAVSFLIKLPIADGGR